ncbi:DNA-formamidopyrimidine glycosylase [Desulfitobacterium dehalogenans]|nr:DNA-formamidopyrimidine glycosylase [Desulfitobacterium dehalogenans]
MLEVSIMPEIPEMETYKDYLQLSVLGKKIVGTEIVRERSTNVPPDEFVRWVQDTSIEQVLRCGKYLILSLSSGKALCAHMMLDGRIYYEVAGEPVELPGSSHIQLRFEDDSILHFCDLRLGYLKLLDPSQVQAIKDGLGPDPLDSGFSFTAFLKILSAKRGMIKPLLMDQKNISGIGNAYSNEILFAAGILPERKVPTLTDGEKERLYSVIPDLLRQAIEKGGYIEEPFAFWDNLSGGMIPYFKVYDRSGQPCLQCGDTIRQKIVGGRNAYYCLTCQH